MCQSVTGHFLKSVLPLPPGGLVCHESGINETAAFLHGTMYSTTQQRGRGEERRKERNKETGRKAEKNTEGGDGSGGE